MGARIRPLHPARVRRLRVDSGAVVPLVCLLLFGLPIVAGADRDASLPVGARVPEVQLGDPHGKPFRLGEMLAAHRYVVLAFYPKAFTGG